MDEPVRRDELEAGYVRPYARWLPLAYRANHVPRLLAVVLTLGLACAAAEAALVEGAPGTLVAVTLLAAALVLAWTAWVTAVGVQVIRRLTVTWQSGADELDRVRARREHAGEADPDVAHEEYAVAVDDRGELVTWRFTPLLAAAEAPAGARVLPGVPVHTVDEVARVPFEAADAGRAAEQLAEAQQDAARREAEAARAAHEALARRDAALELEGEARSTAQALRRHTGQ